MSQISKFELPEKIVYGQDALSKLGETAAELGKKALVVSDRIMEKVGYVARVEKELADKGIACSFYLDANTEPTDLFVDDALKICKDGG
ncbi:MAG: iron-containing alcohol dehydrogenase, partial [Youngiibacter sp.]|nr:iron-containing alcohol dehydrogenase [Youngiibacter sp.]